MKRFYAISVFLVVLGLIYINFEGGLPTIDFANLGRKSESVRPIRPKHAPIKRKEIKILTEKDVKNIKLVNVEKIPPENQLLIKAIKRGSSTVIRSKNRQDEVFVLKEINVLAPSFQTTLGTNKKNKQESNQRIFNGSSATKYSAPASKIAMAFYNNSISGIISRADGSSTYIQSDSKTGKIYAYTAPAREPSCQESVSSEGEVVYNFSPSDENSINIKEKGEEIEILPAENTETGGTILDDEAAATATGINPPEYDKSLININWLIWVDKSSTNIKDKDGNLIFTLEEHAAFQLVKVAMMNALYQNQLGFKFILQEIVLMPENDPQDDPVYTSDETTYVPNPSEPYGCLQEGARCGPIGAAKHLMEKYRPRESYHWDQVPYQMKKKEGDTYKWGGLAGCCAGTTNGVYVNNFSTGGLGAIPHETGHNLGIAHLMGGGVMGGSGVDGKSFFYFASDGKFKGIKLGTNLSYEKMSPKSWFTSLHPKYSQMRNPDEMPWAVADNYQLVVGSDPSSREITISPMTNDLLFTPEGKWNESLDIPEIGPIYPPNAGVLTLLPDNQVKYVASEGFYGSVKFRYTLRGHLPAYLHGSTEPKCLHADKKNTTFSNIAIENCDTQTDTPENKDYKFYIPSFPGGSPIYKIKNNGGCLRPYSGSEDIAIYGKKNFADISFVGACDGKESWDKWIFEPVAMGIPDVYRIKNEGSGFCLNSMKNTQSECNDINNYWQVNATQDPTPQKKCMTGYSYAIDVKDCGDLDSSKSEDEEWVIEDLSGGVTKIKRGNKTKWWLAINSIDQSEVKKGQSIALKNLVDNSTNLSKFYGYEWFLLKQGFEESNIYKIKNKFSNFCLSRFKTQVSCDSNEITWAITPSGTKYKISPVPDGNFDVTYQLESVRQPRDGWLHAGDVTINVLGGPDAPTSTFDPTQNLQVTIPMNSFQYWGKDADIEEFYFNPLIDLTLAPQPLDAGGVPISIYRNPIQMDIALGTNGATQTVQRNAISIEAVEGFSTALADHRIITESFTVDGLSQKIANGYIAVKLKRDISTGDYLEDPITFNVSVKDQKGEIKDVTVNIITPIARIHLDRVELPVDQSLSLITKAYRTAPEVSWRKIYGPGKFSQTDNTATFSGPGKYLLRMTANKDEYSTFQEVSINVLTATGEKLVPDEPLAPGEAPPTNKIVIRPDGTQIIITPGGAVYTKDPVTGDVIYLDEGYKQISMVNSSNFAYINNDGFLFVIKDGRKFNTGVIGSRISMGVDGFTLAILDESECLSRGKDLGCIFEYRDELWVYWGYQKFTSKNATHEILSEMRDIWARDLHVLSADKLAIVATDGKLYEMSEHISTKVGVESRGKEFWELGGLWRKVKLSVHGRILGLGEDNTLKKLYKGSWFPIKLNIGDFEFEDNGRISTVDFDNKIEKILELYLSSFIKISAKGNVAVFDISLGQDGLGHMAGMVSDDQRKNRYFGNDLGTKTIANATIPDFFWKSWGKFNLSVAKQSRICVNINNTDGLKIYNGNENADAFISVSYQHNVVCAADGTVMSIITDENAAEIGIPPGSALQLINGSWYPVGGRFKQLDIGSEHYIYGVDFKNRVWKKEGEKWKRVPGKMKQIAVGADGTLAGIGSDDFVYLMIDREWINLDVKGIKVAASVNNQIVYIDMNGIAYANYPDFFPIPIIKHDRRSILRPRKGVAFNSSNDYEEIYIFPESGLGIYEPINLPLGHVNLGHVISKDYPTFKARTYSERGDDVPDLMIEPTDYEEIATLDASKNLKVYNPVAKSGYSCLGHIAWAPEDPTSEEKPPLELIRCIDSAYVENANLEAKGDNIFRVIPVSDTANSTEYFEYWDASAQSTSTSGFYIPLPKKESGFSLFSSAYASGDTPTVGSEDESVAVWGALLSEEFLTSGNLSTLDDELAVLAEEEIVAAESILSEPTAVSSSSQGGGNSDVVSQFSCGKSSNLDASGPLFFISNFCMGFLLTLFRRKK